MGREIEYKLKAKDARELDAAYERVRACAGTSPERYIEMLTRYFDTPEGLLKDRRWTLRIRRENDRAGADPASEAFFELELELYSGHADRLAELARIAALPEEVLSKQARAMRLL